MRVLVVDDNRDAADMLGWLLRLWGHDGRVAYDGPAGLAAALAEPPDVLLLDLGLPGLDGYAVAGRVRREPALAAAKLVAVSAYDGGGTDRRARAAGFDDRLVKPADPDALRGLLAMYDQLKQLAEQTEELARRNVGLAGETKDLLREVKQDIREVKQEVQEVKEE